MIIHTNIIIMLIEQRSHMCNAKLISIRNPTAIHTWTARATRNKQHQSLHILHKGSFLTRRPS